MKPLNTFTKLNTITKKASILMPTRTFIYDRKRFRNLVFIVLLGLIISVSAHDLAISQDKPLYEDENIFAQFASAQDREDDSLISIQFSNITIQKALELLTMRINVGFSYNSEVIPDNTVTFSMTNVPPHEVIYKILEGTNLEPVLPPSKDVIIIRKKAPVEIENIFEETITGRVVDAESGESLPGVNITVQGTDTGTSTDINGMYEITVSTLQETLIFSFVGFQSQTVLIDGRKEINVSMVMQVFRADELVVVGYGTQRRSDVTGAVANVSAEEIDNVPYTSLSEGLQGRIPGLDIVSSGAGPGSENTLLLRGQRSFTASNDPLIILDGSPYYGSLNDINRNDVESVNVLKDASSTAIYGARGANGVILISTKRGEMGKPQFRLESYTGLSKTYGRIPFALANDYAEIGREAYRAIGAYPEGYSAEHDKLIFDVIELDAIANGGSGLDYQDMLFEAGWQQEHQLSVQGGTEAVKYNFAGGYLNDNGIIPGEEFNRYNVRANLDFTLSDKIDAGTSIFLSRTTNEKLSSRDEGNSGGAIAQVFRSSPLGKLTDDEGKPTFQATTDGLVLNPFVDYEFDSYRWNDEGSNILVTAFANAKILPVLNYRLNIGATIQNNAVKESAGSNSLTVQRGSPIANVNNYEDKLYNYESILTYDNLLAENHHITVTGVHGIQTRNIETSSASVSGLPYENSRYYNIGSATDITGVESSLEETALISYAGRFFYSYKSKYTLTLSLRADGASQFSEKNKWGYFPSIAVAYNIADEPFMESTRDWLSQLKVRVGYGQTGNQAIEPYQTQGGLERTTYSFDNSGAFGYRPIELSNQDLKWETTEVFNGGIDFALWAGRVSGSLDVYNTNTYDLLMFRFLPITSGFRQVLQNVGSTNNKGFEIDLKTINVNTGSFSWSSGLTYTRNRTKIEELYQGTEDDIGNQWFIGHPIGVIYDFKKIGIWQLNEAEEAASYGREPGQIKVQDVNNDGAINDDDRMILGHREPDFLANITNNFNYKNWNLSFSTYIRWGGMTEVNNFDPFSKKRYNKLVFNYWTPDNPTNDYPRPHQDYEGGGLNASTLRYRDASYISLRDLSLGYDIPIELLEKLNIASRAYIYLSGKNLLYWTKSEVSEFNIKPDWSGDVIQTYPAVRTITLGINIDF